MTGTLILQFLVLTAVASGVIIFFLKKILFDSTQGAVNRLNRETETVRAQQAELNEKIKLANEELDKRRKEAEALAAKMKEEAESKGKEEWEKIIKKARSESEEIITKAQKTKDDMRKVIEREMAIKSVDFSNLVLNEILSDKVKGAFNDGLIAEFLDSLERVDMAMIGEKIKAADVVTALPLAEELKNRLVDIIKKKLNRSISLNSVIDPKIISGVIVKFESLSLDGSLAHLLKEKGIQIKDKIDRGMLKVS